MLMAGQHKRLFLVLFQGQILLKYLLETSLLRLKLREFRHTNW